MRRPPRHLRATLEVALLGILIAAILAGHHRHGPAPSAVGAVELRADAPRERPAPLVPAEILRPPQRGSWAPATTAVPRAKAAPQAPGAIVQPSAPAQDVPERNRTVADVTQDAPVVPPFTDPPPAEPLSIGGVGATVTSSSVRVTWQTNFPSIGQGAQAFGAAPVVWTAAEPVLMPSALTHETVFTGLEPGTTYHFWIHATDEWNRAAIFELSATTAAPVFGPTPATVNGTTIMVAGQPFFPIALWEDCTNLAAEHIAVGVNLFIREGCGHENRLAASLEGRAYAVVDPQSGIANQPGVIGWYYTDELDGRQGPGLTAADISRMAITPPPDMLTFLTLTNHFYSGAAPLGFSRSLYPAFAALANVVSFDLYPLQEWCNADRLGDVFDSQRELAALANNKPTFEWIEVRHMKCPAALDPTPQTVAAEAWLSIAGGATGIGWFPHEWSPAVGDAIRSIDLRIGELKSALLASTVTADATAPLKTGARSLNGALYVIAVNPTQSTVDGTVHVDGADARTFDVLDEGRQVVAADGVIKDSFAPLAVHIYVSAPAGW